MFRAWPALLSAFLSISCSLAGGRKPAFLDYEPSVCASKFIEVGKGFTLDPARFHKMETARKGYAYIKNVYPVEIATAIAQVRPVCEKAVDLVDLAKDIQLKSQFLSEDARHWEDQRARMKSQLSAPMLSDPDFPAMASCLAQCTRDGGDCAQACEVPSSMVESLLSDPSFTAIRGACANSLPEMRAQFAIWPAIWKKQGRQSLLPLFEDLAILSREALRAATDLKANVNVTANPQCAKSETPWLAKVRRAIAVAINGDTSGTGFYFSTPTEARFATTEHLYNRSENIKELDVKALTVLAGFRGARREEMLFRPDPQLFARDHDVVQSRVAKGYAQALTLHAAAVRPEPDQLFFAAGFPKATKFKFSTLRCHFYGYGPRTDREDRESAELFWVLRCPLTEQGLAGMSGGPLLDTEGNVWGVVVGFNLYMGRIYVTPLGLNTQGQVQVGIRDRFDSELCLGKNEFERRPCIVAPNFFDRTTP